MIPRFSPGFGTRHLAAYSGNRKSIEDFEKAFAKRLGCPDALMLPRGRTAAYLFLKTLERGNEVILPAYTCLTMPPAILAGGWRPRFVDNANDSFSMNSTMATDAITSDTRGIIVTPMYGYDIAWDDYVRARVSGVPILLDAALALGLCLADLSILENVDAAFFAFGLGKEISTLSGGMLVSRNSEVIRKSRAIWHAESKPATQKERLKLAALLPISMIAFQRWTYRALYELSERTRILDGAKGLNVSRSLSREAFVEPLPFQGKLGVMRLNQVEDLLGRKREKVARYDSLIGPLASSGFPRASGATMPSYYPVVTPFRDRLAAALARSGVHASTRVFDYVAGSSPVFGSTEASFPHAEKLSREVLLLPLHDGVSEADQKKIADVVRRELSRGMKE